MSVYTFHRRKIYAILGIWMQRIPPRSGLFLPNSTNCRSDRKEIVLLNLPLILRRDGYWNHHVREAATTSGMTRCWKNFANWKDPRNVKHTYWWKNWDPLTYPIGKIAWSFSLIGQNKKSFSGSLNLKSFPWINLWFFCRVVRNRPNSSPELTEIFDTTGELGLHCVFVADSEGKVSWLSNNCVFHSFLFFV